MIVMKWGKPGGESGRFEASTTLSLQGPAPYQGMLRELNASCAAFDPSRAA